MDEFTKKMDIGQGTTGFMEFAPSPIISGVDKIVFSNGAEIRIDGDGLILANKGKTYAD